MMADAAKSSNLEFANNPTDDVKADFEQLREDLNMLKKDLAALLVDRTSEAKASLKDGVEAAEAHARAAVETATSEMEEIQRQAEKAVRKKPITAVAAALAIGYFLGGVVRR